tara:strand:- start:3038 stop:3817 length:780 start_codon:yes stop_codon:yes gene_type:complete
MSTIKLNEKTLKNVVKRVIKETRNKKTTINEKQLLREHKLIVNKTFQGISKKYKVINESNSRDIFNTVASESIHLGEQGVNPKIINEGIMSLIFGATSTGAVEGIRTWLIGWVLSLFGVKESGLRDAIAISLGNVPLTQWPKLFSSCEFLLDKTLKGVVEYYLRKFTGTLPGGGMFSSWMGESMNELVDDAFIEDMKKKAIPILCDKLKDLKGRVGDATQQKVSPTASTDSQPEEYQDAGSGLTGFISNLFGKKEAGTV